MARRLISKILFQFGELMKISQNKVKQSYHSNMSTISKLSLKCVVAFTLTENVYFVAIAWKLESYEDLKITSSSLQFKPSLSN